MLKSTVQMQGYKSDSKGSSLMTCAHPIKGECLLGLLSRNFKVSHHNGYTQ